MLTFQFFPLYDGLGDNMLPPDKFLGGFANPALIAVLSLLVLGQAVIHTGALNGITNFILKISNNHPLLSIGLVLLIIMIVSGFVNNTPTVVIFIPIMIAIANQLKLSSSKVMIPVSYASILGGTVTLIGSSSNLLVAGSVVALGLDPLGFFDFTIPGLILAGIGILYVIFVLPKVLPDHAPLADELVGSGDRQFVAQLEIDHKSDLVGKVVQGDSFFEQEDITLKMVQRSDHAFRPPFDGEVTIQPGDVLVVTTTRQAITDLIAEKEYNISRALTQNLINESSDKEAHNENDITLAEVLITPASRMIGLNIEQVGFFHNYHCIVLGIQRRSRVITARMTEIRLAAGDVLLVMGSQDNVQALRESKDALLMEWSTEEIPSKIYARRVNLIFGAVVGVSALGIIPIYLAAFMGALAAILTGCINLRQARRSIDPQIIMIVTAGIGLSVALEATGGASFLAESIVGLMEGIKPVFIMAALFLLMGFFTNILSNNATALIFTPITVNTAHQLGVDPAMFIFAVIFATNCCSLASPIGYQTNLLVMAPGHYKFMDYIKAGLPLVLLIWAAYTAYAYFVF
jgi:di/tricarboxylate transporter